MNKLQFNDFGLAIGLVSYPFYTDGKKLFKDIFEKKLFKPHIENLSKFSINEANEFLYKPKGYRLLGNHGLVILSLIDDYAFCNRIFNANHVHEDEDLNIERYASKVITGISESNDDRGTLSLKAKNTFLKETDRYPFIGILKMKIDHRLLNGKGLKLTALIKKAVSDICPTAKNGVRFDYIIVDCFDNNELSIIAFSNNMFSLYQFLCNVKKLKNDDIIKLAPEKEKPLFLYTYEGSAKDKHVFTSCHISLGYDIDYSFDNTTQNDIFQAISNKKSAILSLLNINFICETKPGHDIDFVKLIKEKFSDEGLIKKQMGVTKKVKSRLQIKPRITGGMKTLIILPFDAIHDIENLCIDETFKMHLRKVEMSLSYSGDYTFGNQEINKESHELSYNPRLFDTQFIIDIKRILDECGVSKVLRERLLSVYRLYNESVGNLLHTAYFEELYDSLFNMKSILQDFCANENMRIKDIDKILSDSIVTFEEAFYNRFHENGLANINLEYNGSIQQYLTCFNFVYKEILRIYYIQTTML